MPDLERRLPELLRDLSADAPSGAGRSGPILRRARRRRVWTAAAATVSVVAVLGATVLGARALAPAGRTSVGGSPTPTTSMAPPSGSAIGAVWPETTSDGLAFAQQQADDGHQPWRTDPAMTAEAFAVNVFGWRPEDVRSAVKAVPGPGNVAAVKVAIADGPVTDVVLDQLGDRGDNGVWSVTSADTAPLTTTLEEGDDGSREVRVRTADGASVQIGYAISAGETLDSPVSGGAISDGSSIPLPTGSATGAVVVIVSAIAGGDVVGADVFSVPTALVPSPQPTVPPTEVSPSDGLPPAVTETRNAILRSIQGGDISALAPLIDPNTFAYNFDDGSNPIPTWKRDPSVLDPIPAVLALPAAAPKDIEGYGTFYVWPYLVDSDLEHLSATEVDDLHSLGFDDAAIEDMRRFGSYSGPRLAIDENGLWRNYTTGGD